MAKKSFNDEQRQFLVHLLTHQEIKDFFFGKLDLEEVLDSEAINELFALGISKEDKLAFQSLWEKLRIMYKISDDLTWLKNSQFKEVGEEIAKLSGQLLQKINSLQQDAYKNGYETP